MNNLADTLAATAARHPHAPALRLDGDTVRYAELAASAARIAGQLHAAGIRPGDRVALQLPNVPAFAAHYYGILHAGAVVVPMNPLLKAREIAHQLTDSAAALLLTWPADTAAAAEAEAAGAQTGIPVRTAETLPPAPGPGAAPVDRAPSDTAVILYTSGTTGRPKGAELTHANLAANARVSATTLLGLGPGDTVFGGLPLFHAFGQVVGLIGAVRSAACLTLLPRFDPAAALRLLERDRVTVLLGVPTMYAALLHHPDRDGYDTGALRLCVSGGAALPVEVLTGFEAAYGCAVLEGYGLSETSPVASFNHPDRPRRPGTVGTPVEGVEMRVLDPATGASLPDGEVGEIAVRGHNVMKGYWRNPEATAEAVVDGWFRTGDLGTRDADGYFRIVDRSKDLVIRGGYNVYPREVEEVLYEHPAVAEAAVIGVPHPLHGQEVAAVVALKPGAAAGADELRQYVKDRVAPYKYPRLVRITDALPKGPTGKILKRELPLPTP
ncbi:long-chain fatty acid--CoA ligase [Kitasatospora sp. NPDC048365]|uniref:long-chain-fatty-acid--CoA ligase n=1 Tax=Kitasatospora sp. NPDC048365 TaxID=3364050 RepID=UPI003716D34E